MGVKRLLIHTLLPESRVVDGIKNIKSEGGIIEGYKKSINDEIEDIKAVSPGYKLGVFDGKKEGYSEASDVYEKKLMEQADLFLNQIKDYKKVQDEYDKLLDEYEKEIQFLTEKNNKTEKEKEYLQELLDRERKLKRLKAS